MVRSSDHSRLVRRWVWLLVLLVAAPAAAQPSSLTVDQIMQDPEKWVGGWPDDPRWSDDGSHLYFRWNPSGLFPADSLFKVSREGGDPVKISPEERRNLPPMFEGWRHAEGIYTPDLRNRVFEQNGDIHLFDRATGVRLQLTETRERETDPRFAAGGGAVIYRRGDALYKTEPRGLLVQLTDLRPGSPPEEREPGAQDAFLKEQQQALFGVLREREKERALREAEQERTEAARERPPTFYYGDGGIEQLQIDPTERFVTFVVTEDPREPRDTEVHDYVTESGYAEGRSARPKVGAPVERQKLYLQDLPNDTTYWIDLTELPGSRDVPAFLREQGARPDSAWTRTFYSYGPYWSGDGRFAVLDVRTADNKDRYIVRLDPFTRALEVLDRQHDEAWIAGPGISWWGGRSDVGWLPDNRRFYFQSERTGYSHLYVVDVQTGAVEQLTEGPFEVSDPQVSRDGKSWYFASTEGSPFERHYYEMPIDGGPRTRLTTQPGVNEVALHPDAAVLGVLNSRTNRPPDLFLQPPGGEASRITHSPTSTWLSYDWRDPEIVRFEASDGVEVPAHLFVPEQPNGAAVLFVHGAGYLQNVHEGWSENYYREYMFHNLLADLGYYVMNVDYRGSAGYGRDWRTAIYRHMGGRDLQDYVDASRFLGRTHGIDPERVFIYGGSYGGFLTLMALFNESEHFGGGAALRSVTDWAHYNHGYTANILNTPAEDSLAYARSSPIYFAEGLEDPLLIAHGVVDDNVHFQDVVRLAQRLIELGKEDWELALYPVEGHGFTEPSSWADEYRRILKTIRLSVGPEQAALEQVPFLDVEETR